MNNKMQIFTNEEFGTIRTIEMDGQIWFVAKDIAEILGYEAERNAIKHHVDDEDKLTHQISASGQNRNMTIINESGLYCLILSSKLPTARAFRRWITTDVLPSIRKHRAYIEPDVLDEIMADSQAADNLLRKLKSEQSQNARLKGHIKYMAPRARFCDKVLQSESLLPITLIAKDYGFSAVGFNRLLHDFGIQYRVGGTWVLYNEYADKGYTKTRTYTINETETSTHTYWTLAGYKFIFEFLKFYGILPTEPRGYGEKIPSLAGYGGNDLFEI